MTLSATVGDVPAENELSRKVSSMPEPRNTGANVIPELLDVRSVCTLLGNVSGNHVRRLTDSGRMPAAVRIGVLIRWRRAEILNWIEEGCPAVRPRRAGGA